MGAFDPTTILRTPGRLCVNPTDLTAAWPHGGVGLGEVGGVVVLPRYDHVPIPAQEFGSEVQDVVYAGCSYVVSAALRSAQDDAVLRYFAPNSGLGATSGERGVSESGSVGAGVLLSTVAVKLLFTPNDVLRDHAWYFPVALPVIDRVAEFALTRTREKRLLVSAYATRDATGRSAYDRYLADLVL